MTYLKGNPNDADMFLETIESLGKLYSVVPKKTSCDGGFFELKKCRKKSKELGAEGCLFSKKM